MWEDGELCSKKVSAGLILRSAAAVDCLVVDAITEELELVSICGKLELPCEVIFEISVERVAPFVSDEVCPSGNRLLEEVIALETKDVAPGEVPKESCEDEKLPLEIEKK